MKPPPDEEEEVRSLLTDAGRRPEVPQRDLTMIRAAARAEWQELVAGRRKRRHAARRLVPLTVATSLILALALGWWWTSQRSPIVSTPIATVELLKGDVRVQGPPDRRSEQHRELTVGDALIAGTTLMTEEDGSPGIVTLTLAGGESVRLDSGARTRLVSRNRLALETGTLYVDSGDSPGTEEGLEIVTALGSVREIGTQFEVRVAEGNEVALRVRVRDGTVSVASGAGSHTVSTGEELRLRRDGGVERGAIVRHGVAWEWVVDAAPALDIDGLPLGAFLRWVSRETGWEVRYVDPAFATDAETIVVRGSIEGLSPDEAVSVVLPGSRVDYRLEDGILFIEQP